MRPELLDNSNVRFGVAIPFGRTELGASRSFKNSITKMPHSKPLRELGLIWFCVYSKDKVVEKTLDEIIEIAQHSYRSGVPRNWLSYGTDDRPRRIIAAVRWFNPGSGQPRRPHIRIQKGDCGDEDLMAIFPQRQKDFALVINVKGVDDEVIYKARFAGPKVGGNYGRWLNFIHTPRGENIFLPKSRHPLHQLFERLADNEAIVGIDVVKPMSQYRFVIPDI